MGKIAESTVPKPVPGDQTSIAAQYARAMASRDDVGRKLNLGTRAWPGDAKESTAAKRFDEGRLRKEWWWVMSIFVFFLLNHVVGIYFFKSGFLLTRIVLDEKSSCTSPPIPLATTYPAALSPQGGCWHPKTFDRAIVIVIDALRYDFTVPYNKTSAQAFHNSFPYLYETAVAEPHNAFLRPFIADPPTTTLQRLKGLTTGSLPTFIDAGSNFAGTAIEEDNLLMQLRHAGRKIVHLGDDTWTALFPGYFEEDISRAYDSLNVWDLHSLDNGVTEHLFPLLKKENMEGKWDVMFAHFLGVDHAGHRYGPNHPAMTSKLQQMNGVIEHVVEILDQDTLLVVMGDHGMDSKGDHGGESDDEVEAALWMYSKKGIFGHSDTKSIVPPPTAKIRPVNQIDLVPTLALLLGIPIPFSNLGAPIEEAFLGAKNAMWNNLASISRLTAAGIQRYQVAYRKKTGEDEMLLPGSPSALWENAEQARVSNSMMTNSSKQIFEDFSAVQVEALRIFRAQWSRFDVSAMALGITIFALGLLSLLLYASSHSHSRLAIEEPEPEKAKAEEVKDLIKGSHSTDEDPCRPLVVSAAAGTLVGVLVGYAIGSFWDRYTINEFCIAGGAICGLVGVLTVQLRTVLFRNPLPKTLWGWLAIIFTVSQCVGYASNSYTIWEDSILLYFLSTFGLVAAIISMRLETLADRTSGVFHSLLFVVLGWVASFSKLCREEQIPYCKSTYYASSTSSTSAPWQLFIPLVIAIALPSIVRSYYTGSRSYEGFAPIWIGWALRFGLILNAAFWILDAADDGEWFASLAVGRLKEIRVPIAFTIIGLSLVAGPLSYRRATPCISIERAKLSVPPPKPSNSPTPAASTPKQTILILGYGNVYGALYLLLPLTLLLSLLLVQKPMGQGALSLFIWQALSLFEILDLNSLTTDLSPIGPIALSLLSSLHFFKTGHQHVLSTIQWETAFIPFYNLIYPWSPLLVVWNTFGAAILGTSLLPLTILWKRDVREKKAQARTIRDMGRQMAIYTAYWVAIALACMCWAGWLRRHLMLYRIFSPRFMGAVVALLIVDVVGILVGLVGVRINVMGVGRMFG